MTMRVDPKALIRRLDPVATEALEEAVARAAAGRAYEIVVEHILYAILAPSAGEVAEAIAEIGGDRGRALASVEAALRRLRSGNAGRPAFAEAVFRWIEEAWLVASIERGRELLTPLDLLLEFVVHAGRYTGEPLAELGALPRDGLRREAARRPGLPPQGGGRLGQGLSSKGEGAGPPPAGSPTAPADAGGEALGRFTVSLTERARRGEIDPVFGRDREIRQMVDILARRRKNNPILVGEPGVGKTALVEGLARAIVAGEVPAILRGTELRVLDLGLLMAGAGVRGEIEARLKRVIAEVKGAAAPVILFIDEAHTLMGSGEGSGGELPNLLKPELARGELRTIAATTWSEYKKYFEKDAALARRFQPVKVDEPAKDAVVLMLRGLRPTYERAHQVTIRDDALVAAVELSDRYIAGRLLPDKAIDLVDTAAARVRIGQEAPPEALLRLRTDLSAAELELEAIRRDRLEGRGARDDRDAFARVERLRADEAALAERWRRELAAVAAVIEARAAARAAEGADRPAAIAALERARADLAERGGEVPLCHAEVDPEAVAQVVGEWTGIPVGKLRAASIAELLDLERRMSARIRGQDDALQIVAEAVRMSHAGVRDPGAPVAVLLFVGPSGVGKTETALALADLLYGGERQVTSINMSEFQEKHSVSRLIGSPPGYVGYGEGGVLTEAVRQRPHSVVLLDECEKADLEVMNLFYQVFDKGVLSDGEGREVDFRHAIVILTSNLAADRIAELHRGRTAPSLPEIAAAVQPILSRHFKPALLARMTVVPYRPMDDAVLRDIASLKLARLGERLRRAHGVAVEFRPAVLDALAERCRASESGARALDHILRGSLMPTLARALLEALAAGAVAGGLAVDHRPELGWQVEWAQ